MDHGLFSEVLEEGRLFFFSLPPFFFAEVAEYRSPFRKTLLSFTPSPSLQGGGVSGWLFCLTASKLAVGFCHFFFVILTKNTAFACSDS